MTHKESLISPTNIFYYFILSIWPWVSLERESYFQWSPGENYSQCHSKQVLVNPCKTPDHVKDLYYGQTYDLKTRVDIWTSIDVVPVDHGTFSQTFYMTMWFFQSITGINFKWYYVL